jgi:hypothetical protein
MEKIVGDWHIEVTMSADEAKEVCKMGSGAGGFECIRMSYPANGSIFSRLKDGTMKAKGEGGWAGCAWHGEI